MPQQNTTKRKKPAKNKPADNSPSGRLICVELPTDFDRWRQGDGVLIKQGAPIENGQPGLVEIRGKGQIISYIFQLGSTHIRLGLSPKYIFPIEQVKMIGPIVGGGEFMPITNRCQDKTAKADGKKSARTRRIPPDSARVTADEDEWPDLIGGDE